LKDPVERAGSRGKYTGNARSPAGGSGTRIELAIYADSGGVQPPARYEVEFWDGKKWRVVTGARKSPEKPTGGQFNEVRFGRVTTSKVRVVFTHAGKARSDLTEILVWDDR
jgi:hypothetical protein